MLPQLKKFLILFLAGALLGTTGDYFHHVSNTAGYNHPSFLGLAWWVPFLFGFATLGFAFLTRTTDYLFRKKSKRPSLAKVIISLTLFEGLYLFSGYLPDSSKTKIAILYILAVVLVVILDPSVYAFVLSIAIASIGTLAEVFIVSLGNFHYTQPEWHGVPYWLPSLYMVACVAIAHTARYLFNEKRIYV